MKHIDIEQVRTIAFDRAGDDDPLDFYSAAVELGATEEQAEAIDIRLTTRVMTARGAI